MEAHIEKQKQVEHEQLAKLVRAKHVRNLRDREVELLDGYREHHAARRQFAQTPRQISIHLRVALGLVLGFIGMAIGYATGDPLWSVIAAVGFGALGALIGFVWAHRVDAQRDTDRATLLMTVATVRDRLPMGSEREAKIAAGDILGYELNQVQVVSSPDGSNEPWSASSTRVPRLTSDHDARTRK